MCKGGNVVPESGCGGGCHGGCWRATVAIVLWWGMDAEVNLDRNVGIRRDSIEQGRKGIDIKERPGKSGDNERR